MVEANLQPHQRSSQISLSAADYSLGITHRVALDIFSNGVKVITFNFELYF